jgi:hypothetical protein
MPPRKGILSRLEETIYFRIARGFAWLILLAALVGFAGSAFMAASSVKNFFGGEKAVTASDVKDAIAANKASAKKSYAVEDKEETFDPKAEGQLTTEIGEIFALLNQEQKQQSGGWEEFRRSMPKAVGGSNPDEKIGALKQVRSVVNEIEQSDRLQAIREYIELRARHTHDAQARKIEAMQNVTLLGSAIATTAALITLVSMVLVLLAIERNTRRA